MSVVLTDETRRAGAARSSPATRPTGPARRCCRCCTWCSPRRGTSRPAGIAFCAEVLGLTKAQVGAVATFYTMYKRRRPATAWSASAPTPCATCSAARRSTTRSREHLGVGHDETTADGTITLEHAECLAACDYGPVMTVNYEFFDSVDADSALGVVDELRAGERPMPTRGARLCTLKEMAVQLAGFADERDGAVADGAAGRRRPCAGCGWPSSTASRCRASTRTPRSASRRGRSAEAGRDRRRRPRRQAGRRRPAPRDA